MKFSLRGKVLPLTEGKNMPLSVTHDTVTPAIEKAVKLYLIQTSEQSLKILQSRLLLNLTLTRSRGEKLGGVN